jgi:hypothetical protein
MAAIDSPRRILGERDVNKPLFTRPSPTTSSPSKLASFSPNNALHEKTLDLGKLSQVLLSPKMHEVSPYPASINSPSGRRKRGTACLEDVQDGPPRKHAVIGLPQDSCDGDQPRTGNGESGPLQSRVEDRHVKAAAAEASVSIPYSSTELDSH